MTTIATTLARLDALLDTAEHELAAQRTRLTILAADLAELAIEADDQLGPIKR